MNSQQRSYYLRFLQEFALGGLAATLSKTLASPIEVVKLRLQLQGAFIQQGVLKSPYAGISDCFRRLYIENGVLVFYRGNLTNVVRFFLAQALSFSFKDTYHRLLAKNHYSPLLLNILAGAAAGATAQLLVYPLDYARTILANDFGSSQIHQGLRDCLAKAYQSEGIHGMYRGFTISCLCMVIYRGLYFGIYDSVKPLLPPHLSQNFLINFSVGYAATLMAGVFAYPLDTVRRKMMIGSKSGLACSKILWKEAGWKGFFRGGAANIVGGLTGGIVLAIHDQLKYLFLSDE